MTVEKTLSRDLLDWYDRHARRLPWRVSPEDRRLGVVPEPYRVWLSEIMLQQTTIAHAGRYFLRFIELWPTVGHLAAAPVEDVMREWAGLGYYARARNLHKCAKAVAEIGRFPDTYEGLIALPGIGPYTAGAIAAIAFNRPHAAVDGNVDRVMSRLLALKTDWKAAKARIRTETETLVPEDRPGDFAQAMMDLGATVCTPKKPACALCPWQAPCLARQEAQPETYPIKPAKAPKPVRYGTCFAIEHEGEVCLIRRPDKGLLGGMLAFPSTDWAETRPGAGDEAVVIADITALNVTGIGDVRHVFTHFELYLSVKRIQAEKRPHYGIWVRTDTLMDAGLPSVFAKAAKLVLD